MKIIEEFKDIPYLGHSKIQVINDATKSYFFLVKQSQLLKNKRQVIIEKNILNPESSTITRQQNK